MTNRVIEDCARALDAHGEHERAAALRAQLTYSTHRPPHGGEMINEAIQMLECVDKQDYADAVRALSARVAELEAQLAEAARQEKIHEWLSDRGWRVCTEKEARHYDSIGRQVRVRFAAPVPAQPSAKESRAFLVENNYRPTPHWLTLGPDFVWDGNGARWTDDADKALKFADAESAQAYLRSVILDTRRVTVTEHIFETRLQPSAPVPAQPSADYWLDGKIIRKGKTYVGELIGWDALLLRELLTGKPAQPSAPVAQPAPAVADGMRLIVDAADLEVGRWYWTRWRDGGTVRMQHVFAHMDDPTKKYVGEGRLWAYPGNDQFTGYLVAVGPVPKAEFDAMLAASAPKESQS